MSNMCNTNVSTVVMCVCVSHCEVQPFNIYLAEF